jgi:II/X family phage/plasmid replication protein
MIDMLVLRCEFEKTIMRQNGEMMWSNFTLASLCIPIEQSIGSDGLVFKTRHPWESIPSSYEGMAFKIFDNRNDCCESAEHFFIEIKASPAKLFHGHNVYGSDDFYNGCLCMMELLCMTYPNIVGRLDHTTWFMAQIDITYSSRADSDREAKLFINALQNVSYGQTKSRTGYDGTAYFGKKNSRLKKIKVYLKSAEVLETIKKNDKRKDGAIYNEVFTPELLEYSQGLIRWEVSLYHRYFERQGISCYLKDLFKNQSLASIELKVLWRNATYDLFTALKGQTMKLINDNDIQDALRAKFIKVSDKTGKSSSSLADSAYRTYSAIRRDGWFNTRTQMGGIACSYATFNRHVKMLTECGLSRAALQNMNGLDDGATIIPFVRFIQVDFGAQFPDNYQYPQPKHVYESNLRLVA